MRMTVQYSLVLDAVRALHCHATADEVYEEVRKSNPHISKGTVYRNLARLCELGEICRRELPGGADGYDHTCSNHYHARCIECGRLFDVDMDYIPDLEQKITDSHGFVFLENDIVFKCVCPACQKLHPAAP